MEADALLAGDRLAFPYTGAALLPDVDSCRFDGCRFDGGGAEGVPSLATPGCPREEDGLLLGVVLLGCAPVLGLESLNRALA